MTFKNTLAALLSMTTLAVPALAGDTFDLSSPENAAICAAKLNDKMTAGDMDGALAMGCYADGAVLRMFVPGNDQPIMTSAGAPDVYAFIKGAFESFGYVATQHLVGSVYKDGNTVHSSVHATHLKADGTLEIGNAEYVDTIVEVEGEYKIASRDIHVVNFSTVEASPVLREQ